MRLLRSPIVWLVLLSCAVQAIVLWRTVAPGLDAARFAKTAERIENHGAIETLRSQSEQPLFPLWVSAVHQALLRCWGPFPTIWAASVHLAALIPLVLAVVPLYAFSVRVYGKAAAVVAGCYFCFLPEVSRLAADGISDSTHLLFFSVALWAAARYWTGPRGKGTLAHWSAAGFPRTDSPAFVVESLFGAQEQGRWAWLLASGVASGLALLTRAEVSVLAAVVLLSLWGFQLSRKTRQSWRRVLGGSAAYLFGVGIVVLPYLAATEALTPQAALRRVLGRPDAVAKPASEKTPAWQLADGQPMSFALKDPGSSRQRGLLAAMKRSGEALARAFWYWIGLFAVFAVLNAGRLRGRGVDWLVRGVIGLYLAAVLLFCWREGYTSPRHLLPLVVAALGAAGVGTLHAAWYYAARTRPRYAKAWPFALPALLCLLCCWQTFQPLGHAMAAHRAAARWLAYEATTPGNVLDTHGLTGLYSGRVTHPFGQGATAWQDPQLAYVVLQAGELTSNSPRAQTLAQLLSRAGEKACQFAGPAGGNDRDLVVYRWHPARFTPPALSSDNSPPPR